MICKFSCFLWGKNIKDEMQIQVQMGDTNQLLFFMDQPSGSLNVMHGFLARGLK